MRPANFMCACPNEVLIFNCTIVGGSATVWSGSAFLCGPDNNIILLHSGFRIGISGACGDAIAARSIGIENNNCFTSQLNVNISSILNNRMVMCSNSGVVPVGNATLTVISGIAI